MYQKKLMPVRKARASAKSTPSLDEPKPDNRFQELSMSVGATATNANDPKPDWQ